MLTIKCKPNLPSKLRDSKKKPRRPRLPPQLWLNNKLCYSNNFNSSKRKFSKREPLPNREFNKLKLKRAFKLLNSNK